MLDPEILTLDMKWRKISSFLLVSEITINGALLSPYQGHLLHEALNEATKASRRAARRGAPMRPSTLSSLPFLLSLSLSLYIYIYIKTFDKKMKRKYLRLTEKKNVMKREGKKFMQSNIRTS